MAIKHLVPKSACAFVASACVLGIGGQYVWFQAAAGEAASINVYNSDDDYPAKLIWSVMPVAGNLTSPMMGPYKLLSGSGVHIRIAGTSASATLFTTT